MEIKELLEGYTIVSNEIENLTKKKEEIRAQILDIFKKNKWEDYKDDQFKARVSDKETYKFIKKSEAIKWLRANGYIDYLKEDIDSSLNKELKNNNRLFVEGLKGTYQVASTKALKVDKI